MTIKTELERLLIAAQAKGHYLRFPQRFEVEPDTQNWVNHSTKALDKLGVSWSIQNTALMFINDIDQQPVWELFFKRSLFKIIDNILEGESFNAIVNLEVTKCR